MAYNAKYAGYFNDINNNSYRIVIREDGFGGSVEDILLPSKPIITEYDYSGDVMFSPIIASMSNLSVVVESQFKFRDFLVADDEKFLMDIRLQGTGTIWAGAIFPDEYKEDYTGEPWIANIKASDGLSLLKQKYLNSYSGRVTAIDVIHECLSKMPSDLYNGEIFENIKSRHGDVQSTEALLENVEVDRENYTEKSNENPNGKDLSCYEILSEILKMFGARIQKGFSNRFEIFETKTKANTNDWFKYINGGSATSTNLGGTYSIDFSGAYDRTTDRFGLFNNQKLFASKPVTAIDIRAEAAHSYSANLLFNGSWNQGQDANGVSVGWEATANMSTIIRSKSENLNDPRLHERGTDSGEDAVNRHRTTISDNYKPKREKTEYQNSLLGKQPLKVSWLIIQGNGGGKSNNKTDSTRVEYIESDKIAIGAGASITLSYELFFQKPWDLGKNEKIIKYPFHRCSIVLEGTSGTTYYANLKSGGNGYEFVDAGSTPFSYVTVFPSNNNSDNEVEVTVDTPESGDVKVRIHGFGSHTYRDSNGNSNFLRVDEMAVNHVSLSTNTEGTFSLRERISNSINYSLRDMQMNVIHLDGNAQLASSGDLSYNGNPINNWTHVTGQDKLTVVENLARLILEAYNKPLRIIEGTFAKQLDIIRLNLSCYSIDDNFSTIVFAPTKQKINWEESWTWMELVEIDDFVNLDNVLAYVNYEVEPNMTAIGTVQVKNNNTTEYGGSTDLNSDKYDTPHNSAVWSKTDNDRHFEGKEPADPPKGESVEWISDGSEDGYSAGEKWMKYTASDGTTTTTKLSN